MKLFSQRAFVFEVPKEVSIAERVFEVRLVLSKKKNSSVQLDKETLIFRLSSYLSEKKKEEHFTELLSKIGKKILKNPVVFREISFEEILDLKYFYFANERYALHFSRKRGVVLKEFDFFLPFEYDSQKIEKKIVQLLCKRYETRLNSYVQVINQRTYNFPLGNFSLRLVKSKWGHCSSKNDIMLNLKLLNAPQEVLDYVIIHELAHIRHKNHSSAFWRLVSTYCPSHKRMKKYLRENPPLLFELKNES